MTLDAALRPEDVRLDALVSHPYSLFLYAIKSPYTRQLYIMGLRKFFNQIPTDGPIELQCSRFMEASSSNKDFALGRFIMMPVAIDYFIKRIRSELD